MIRSVSGLSYAFLMSLRLTFLLCAVFVILGFGLLATGWHGNAGITGAVPLSGSSVQLNGQASGGFAIAGLACLVLGIVFFIWSIVNALAGTFTSSPQAKDAASSARKS